LCGTATKIGTPALWQQRIAEVSRSGLEPIADGIMRRWFSDGFRQRQPEAVRGYRCLLTRSAQVCYLATLSALASADLGNRVSAIAQPTLVVSGALDLSTPPEQGRALAAAIEGSEFEVLADTAHLMCIEQPGLLRQRLLAFVEAVV
jgi:3-oxoadipate enol-lactonase